MANSLSTGRALVNLKDIGCPRLQLPTLALRHPGHAHSLNGAFAPSKEGRIVGPCIGGLTKAANSEAWIERKSRLHCGPRFVQLPEAR